MVILLIDIPDYVALKVINYSFNCQLAQLTRIIRLLPLAQVYKTKNPFSPSLELVPTMTNRVKIDNTYKDDLAALGVEYWIEGPLTISLARKDFEEFKDLLFFQLKKGA